jgi:hypothetical protein
VAGCGKKQVEQGFASFINVFMVEVVEVFSDFIFFLDCARMIGVDVVYDSCFVNIDAVFSSCRVFGCC